MEEITIRNGDEFIKLGQAIKAAGFVESGVEAKIVIQDGLVKVNGNVETQRGKKLVGGEIVEFEGNKLLIKNN
jgi:ribosome-associated protein